MGRRFHKPNTINVLANLACIGALELAQLGTPFDLEKDLLASSTNDLVAEEIMS